MDHQDAYDRGYKKAEKQALECPLGERTAYLARCEQIYKQEMEASNRLSSPYREQHRAYLTGVITAERKVLLA